MATKVTRLDLRDYLLSSTRGFFKRAFRKLDMFMEKEAR